MKEAEWCLTYVNETKLKENNKAAYELQSKINQDLRTNIEVNLLINQKNNILWNIKLETLKVMR
jgi:hypothetical protein